jgi:hypothetical protein
MLLMAAAVSAYAPARLAAEEGGEGSPLPVTRVVLFNSGVGFYQHAGDVDGNDHIEMKFKVEDINDLLKSMVLQDMGGGKISTVSFGSQDPITRTLKSFSLDLTGNPTMADLLNQARGEKVEIESPNKVIGIIVSVETRKIQIDKDNTVETDFLNLLTEDGLRSINMQSVNKLKLANPAMDAELREALAVLALGHSTDKKTVSLSFLGEGKRKVSVGYILEAPVWKTSYRLVLDDEDAPLLQGWAIVENTTDEDWKDVSLSLVSGRPISFTMDLYSPLYANRPEVKQELYASLRPQSYDQDLAAGDKEFRKRGEVREQAALAKAAAAPGAPPADALRRSGRAADEKADGANYRADANNLGAADFGAGFAAAANAASLGEMFKYDISTPVTLNRQRSAMLPIVNESIKGTKVSIYNPSVHVKHPLNGLRLVNSSGLHLMQGPVTVFDSNAYAGDAKFPDLPPGTERLVSYAMDLDTEVALADTGSTDQLVSVKLVKGTLYISRKYTREKTYTVKNSGQRVKHVLLEYPIDHAWKLISPEKPEETTRDMYRFGVDADPGEPETQLVKEERSENQGIAVTNMDDNSIRIYLSQQVVSEKVKEALQEVIKRKNLLQQAQLKRQQLEQQINVIGQEQDRIRKNMAELPKDSDLYLRYIKKFTDQEDDIEKLRKEIAGSIDEENKLRKSLDDYLLGLDLA